MNNRYVGSLGVIALCSAAVVFFVLARPAPSTATAVASANQVLTAIIPAVTGVLTSEPKLSRLDLDGDGVADRVYTYPDGYPNPQPGELPGEVHVVSGATNALLVRFVGEASGDQFGYSVAYAGDRRRDGWTDLLIGAPGANAAYVFDGPHVIACPVADQVVSAELASVKVIAFEADVWDFGFAVAEGYDFRGDGFPDFRVGARYQDNGEVRTREYIFQGYSGLPIARIHRVSGGSDQLARPAGDAVGDGQVTQADIDVVMDNLGEPGSVDEGDFDGDQLVTGVDLIIGTEQLGTRIYDPTFDAAPAGANCAPTKGCSAYLSHDGDNWYCVERIGLGCQDPPGGGGNEPSCEERLAECENEANVQQARQLIQDRCGDNAGSITVRCEDCSANPGLDGVAIPICNGDERRVEVIICSNSQTDLCIILVHELTHAAQACDYGLFDPDVSCDEDGFFRDWNNPYHRMCMELEAYQIDGECQGIQECCEFACNSAAPLWQSHCECVNCCVNNANCCQNGRNTCVDNGQDPCPPAKP